MARCVIGFSRLKGFRQGGQETLPDQRALARTAHARYQHQTAQRQTQGKVFKIVGGGVVEREPFCSGQVSEWVRGSGGQRRSPIQPLTHFHTYLSSLSPT